MPTWLKQGFPILGKHILAEPEYCQEIQLIDVLFPLKETVIERSESLL